MRMRTCRRLDQIEIAGDLDDVARLEEQLDRLFARPRPENRARVEVMTIHKSKGLGVRRGHPAGAEPDVSGRESS